MLGFFEQQLILPAKLRALGVSRFRHALLTGISCWWAEGIRNGDRAVIEQVHRAGAQLDALFFFSRNQKELFQSAGLDTSCLFPIPFGVDETFYCPTLSVRRGESVVASGIDRGRDWDTLVAAASLLPQVPFEIYTQAGRVRGSLPTNVAVHAPVSMPEHRNALRSARLVVVPTHDLAYPTGQSVMLEAAACGTPVLATRTEAMSEYIDGSPIRALPLHDHEGAAEAIESALQEDADPAGAQCRRFVEQRNTFEITWQRVAKVILELMTMRRK
jgi:glycosyltransferase involved in cell wall biosynthesis